MCIVVVDDELDVRKVVVELLEDEGYRVLSFGNPVPVTALHETDERPELFVIDIMLPDMNGIALAARLRDEGFEVTPKVAMSASDLMLQVAEESRLFDAAIHKPFSIDALLDTVERHTLA